MRNVRTKWLALGAAAGVAAVCAAAAGANFGWGGDVQASDVTNVLGQPNTNSKFPQVARPNIVSPELQLMEWARGSYKAENSVKSPGGTTIEYYGYDSDVVTAQGEPAMVPNPLATAPGNSLEAHKTEPDKNTYLVLRNQHGADPGYAYGNRFLFQGHEAGPGYLTRINLDADGKHRITIMAASMNECKASPACNGTPQALPNSFDGSTWDPWAERILGAFEDGANGGIVAFTLDYPSHGVDLFNSLGRGGYEGIQNDSRGNVYIVEDVGGTTVDNRRRPNSFVYRFVPVDPSDLTRGKLQALQVLNKAGNPITFESQAAPGNPDQNLMRTYSETLQTKWVTIHDTESTVTPPSPPSAPWPNANAAAKAFQATPFKRPENGVFRPTTNFKEFYFDETGDTSALSGDNDPPATAAQAPGVSVPIPPATGKGGWSSLFKLEQSPWSDTGQISLFYSGNVEHAGLDNMTFLTERQLAVGEDAGDTLHTQRRKLDSAFIFDTMLSYANGRQPIRWLAEGRDASATIDSGLLDASPRPANFVNDGDNETTGIHMSNGDPSMHGILGALVPHPFVQGWSWFWTQQHGDNVTYEVIANPNNPKQPSWFGGGNN